MIQFLKKIEAVIDANQKAAWCIIVESKGSSPRKIGSKMLVYNNNTISGTIGGGALEMQTIEDALRIINQGKPELLTYNLDVEHGMACGGMVKIYIEPINQRAKLYIFGAGHISSQLAPMAVHLDFDIWVIDERENILDSNAFANCKRINSHYHQAIEQLTFDEQTFICVLTHKHSLDMEITNICISKPHKYLGMISSKSKAQKARDYMLSNGVNNELITTIDMPMGIKIACQTPAEIAISILAKLIDVRGNA